MVNKTKKGFTIVELVIVIAVIAILAAVLIPTFSNLINKANESADTMLVKNLNTALSVDAEKHTTMSAALEAALVNGGYDVATITTKNKDTKILWDSKNDLFVYLKGTEVKYIPESTKAAGFEPAENWELFEICDAVPALVDQTYSIYLTGTTYTQAVTVKVGFDAGKNTGIPSVSYENTSSVAHTVIFNTNGGTLTVNAENDRVDFYGSADSVTIEKIASESFHVFGLIVDTLDVQAGHVVLESSSIVSKLKTVNTVTIDAKAGAILVDNSNVANETEKAKTDTAIQNANSKSYLNIETVDELMIALGYEKVGDSYNTVVNPTYYPLIRLKSAADIDISNIKINNTNLDCDAGVIVLVNSSIDLNGGKITTANMNFSIRKDNAIILNGTIQAGANSNKATGINSYALSVEAKNVTLRNLTVNGGISVGFILAGTDALIENCTVKSGDWYAVCAQAGSSVFIKGGTYSRTEIVNEGKNYSVSYIFQTDGIVGDFGSAGDVNRIVFENVKSEIASPFAASVTTATINENKFCNGYMTATIGS